MLPIPSYLADSCIDQNITRWTKVEDVESDEETGFFYVVGGWKQRIFIQNWIELNNKMNIKYCRMSSKLNTVCLILLHP